MDYDSIIIGSGLSGLTCALLLARSGRKVLVVEQHSSPAPVVSGFQRHGIYFDSGFHYAGGAGDGGPLRVFLQHLGLVDHINLFPYAAGGFDRLYLSATEKEYTLPVGFPAIRAYLRNNFPAAAGKIETYFDEIEASWRRVPYLNLDLDLSDFWMESVHGMSLQQRLEVFAPWPQLQSLLSMHSLLYGVSPERTPLALNAQVAGSYYHSVHGIVGGGKRLIDGYLALLRAAGVEIRCNSRVESILATNGETSGVQLKTGETLTAAEVIATVNPGQLSQLLPDQGIRPAYRKRLLGLQQTMSAYIVFARSDESLEFLRQQNVFVQPTAGVFLSRSGTAIEDRPFYLAGADQGGGGEIKGLIGIVPADYSEVRCWESLGRERSPEYREWKKGQGERLLHHFYQYYPQLPQLELLDLATPLTLRDYSLAPEGAIYGVGRQIGQYNPQSVTRLAGLFLAGQAVAGPGLLGTLVSSYLTCGTILGHDVLREELRGCC